MVSWTKGSCVGGGDLFHLVGDLGINFVLDLSASAASCGLGRALDNGAVLAAVRAGGSAVAKTPAVALHL